ncbi:hypothetical protein BO82DRAFT_36729 [Aspergillus uvarum CBS 121591]|uniref:Uncharacterized protein n=1 Tax=Aspergillus uvarum CBS 121591 TaxID=1448315 RepID=A0A319CIU9_9EURO|nr:hypothetical protein BO82DRAFT_36729 [Aspergillus uvarum CBS 121591]PYH75338.1 hypothetical protein BO82DRAFT_36729 [Aspergillus uvarum CBS 121591]
MSRALKDAVRELKAWVTESASRSARIARGEGTPGSRAAPTRTASNDSKIGVRLDNGENVTKEGKVYKRYKVQACKEASNSTIKSLASKNSHKVYAEADVPIDDSISVDDKIKKLFEDLENDVDKKM